MSRYSNGLKILKTHTRLVLTSVMSSHHFALRSIIVKSRCLSWLDVAALRPHVPRPRPWSPPPSYTLCLALFSSGSTEKRGHALLCLTHVTWENALQVHPCGHKRCDVPGSDDILLCVDRTSFIHPSADRHSSSGNYIL